MTGPLPPLNNESNISFMSQIEEDSELNDVNDPEYNRLLDDATKSHRTSKDKIIEAARRLEDLG
jgi:hypothetical protein